ncbi:hypothetical protein OSTOST_14052, partial [Ostertagia ostertagi]
MLSTAFYEPTEVRASFRVVHRRRHLAVLVMELFSSIHVHFLMMIDIDFNSLLLDWGEACQQSALTAFMSTSLMAGALTGSFTAGWLADTYGRLPVFVALLARFTQHWFLFHLFTSVMAFVAFLA